MLKKCTLCMEELDVSNFTRKKNGLQPRCKQCHSDLMKKHYQENKKYYISKARRNNDIKKDKIRQILLEYFSKGCFDCGNKDVRVLEFDHVRDKTSDIGTMLKNAANLEKLIEEIEKCQVVCANCHNIRTSTRANDWRTQAYVSVYPYATNVLKG